jgi:hypothetical protein
MFVKAAKSRLVLDAADHCTVDRAPDGGDLAQREVVVLTISSLAFRLLVLLHLDDQPQARDYFTRHSERPFREAFNEVANLCCGALNQELLKHFPDLGMSTPYTLSGSCISYLTELRPGLVSHYAITIADAVQMGATLCWCANAPLDFVYDSSAAEEETAGALELF